MHLAEQEDVILRLERKPVPAPLRFDSRGRLRVHAPGPSFADVVDAAFNQIRQSACTNVAVAIRMLESIEAIAGATNAADDRAALRRHAEMIARGAREAVPDPDDRIAVETRAAAARLALAAG